MINYSLILNHFVDLARDAVGSELSNIGESPNTYPSVIKARQKGLQPDYPYVVLDILSTSQTSSWKLGEGVDDSGDFFVETPYKLLMQYSVYGGNANSIAHSLETYFRLDRVLGDIRNTTGGAIEQTFEVNSTPQQNSSENLEVAQFNFTFNIVDRFTDSATGTFHTINIDGEAKLSDDDLNPVSFSINETSQ